MIHTTKYFLRKIRKAIHPAESVKHNLSPIHETGFHGDQYLLDFVDEIVPHVDAFIETGTNMGTTIRYMAEKYPALSIFSCEPNEIAFNKASEIVKEYENRVTVYPMPSPDFLYHIHEQHSVLNEQLNLYWLDTYQHDYKRPLYEEIRFITKNQERAIIMVDDAEVPEMPQFQFSKYEGQIYNVDYIQAALMPGKTYQFIHPAYTEHTSPHHALIGVIIIAFGIEIKTNEFFNSRMITKDVE